MKNRLDKIVKRIPIETRIRVSSEMAFINLIVELGYRENKTWSDDEDELLGKLCKLAKEHTDDILKTIDEWEKDGKP